MGPRVATGLLLGCRMTDTLAGRVTPERQAVWLVLLRSRLMLPASPAEAQDAEQDAVREELRLEGRLRSKITCPLGR